MHKKITVLSSPPAIPLHGDWVAFCSKSSEETFFLTMYNKVDCRTCLRYFKVQRDDEGGLLLEIEAFITYCMKNTEVEKKKKLVATPRSK